jgi:hypothetical protein
MDDLFQAKTYPGLVYNNGATAGQAIPLNPGALPPLSDLQAMFATNKPAVDVIWQEFYDSTPLTTATAGQYSFFQNPSALGRAFSNLVGGQGNLPSNYSMVVKAIKFWTVDNSTKGVNTAETKNLFKSIYYQFKVGDKSYNDNQGTKFLMPGANIAVSTELYALNPFQWYNIPVDIIIPPRISFYVDTSWASSTLTNTTTLYCSVLGGLYRNVQ